jgi:hypothetical protein
MLIPGNALRYHYVNPVGLSAAQRKSASGSAGERQEKSTVAQPRFRARTNPVVIFERRGGGGSIAAPKPLGGRPKPPQSSFFDVELHVSVKLRAHAGQGLQPCTYCGATTLCPFVFAFATDDGCGSFERRFCCLGGRDARTFACIRSVFKRLPAGIGDPDADYLYSRTTRTRDDDLSLRCCKAFVNETRDHVAIESVGNDEHLLRDAIRNACEQRQCAAPLVPSKVWFSSMCRHVCREACSFCVPPGLTLDCIFVRMRRPTSGQGGLGRVDAKPSGRRSHNWLGPLSRATHTSSIRQSYIGSLPGTDHGHLISFPVCS